MNNDIKVVIYGASGYTGTELIKYLLKNKNTKIVAITSRQYSGQMLSSILPEFKNIKKIENLKFTKPNNQSLINLKPDAIFFALPHGVSSTVIPNFINTGIKIIDLSADFRLNNKDTYLEFYKSKHPCPELLKDSVYGLPEFNLKNIKIKKIIACPGCYPTSILLLLIPLLKEKIIAPNNIIINSLSGTSGAGKVLKEELIFSEIYNSARPYSVPDHRHLSEIEEQLNKYSGETIKVTFIPHLIPIKSGMLTSITTLPSNKFIKSSNKNKIIKEIYENYFNNFENIRLQDNNILPDTKNVIGTNFADISWAFDSRTNKILLFSAIDNLGKGASGQAIQCLNSIYDR